MLTVLTGVVGGDQGTPRGCPVSSPRPAPVATLKQILDTAVEDYHHPSFGLDDLLIMLREAYSAGYGRGRDDEAAGFSLPPITGEEKE